MLFWLQNYRHGEIYPEDRGSKAEEGDEGTENEEQEIQGTVGKSEESDDVGKSDQVEPDYGPEDGLEDKMARFSFKSNGALFEVLCYDVASDDVDNDEPSIKWAVLGCYNGCTVLASLFQWNTAFVVANKYF